ncbi:MAG: beta-ketoacyl-[acyl-carrier-protein] synthase family protein [Verrucomicrobiia bacterium]|jgi:3-oxoacyl-[acyl-carrier-protein] synthase II
MSERVVVTGMGAVTPLGLDFPSTWRQLVAGRTAAAPVTLFDVASCRCKQAATCALPDFADLPAKTLARLSRASRLALAAAREALADARLLDSRGKSSVPHLPLSVSTTGGGMALGEQFLSSMLAQHRGPGQFYRASRYQAQHQTHDLQRHLGFHGPVTIIANACASGANAIGHGADLIRSGACNCVLAGGYEALTELIYVGFDCLQAMSPDCCRPFDVARNGLMLGEAAAFAVLESESHAQARGAQILCELAGYGHATDLHHLTQPHPRGATAVTVMRRAIAQAGVNVTDIGYVNAHGTGTPLNDVSEGKAFATMFGDGSTIPPRLRISSTKAAIGHTLGAAGSVEALFAIAALQSGQLPPNLNVQQPEPMVAANLVVVGERRMDIPATLTVNLGFGGSNAALVFRRYEPHPRAATHAGAHKPQMSLAICGMGALLPSETSPRMKGLNESTGEQVVCCVDRTREPLATVQNEARVRRASPLTLYMLAAAQHALAAAPELARDRLGVVASFNTGAVVATRRFFEGVIKTGQRFASPNLFPETVFNSPTSHVAAVLGAAGPCYSLVGDDAAWVTAIRVAAAWLANGLVDHALVIGAVELDPIVIDAFARTGWLPPHGQTGYVPSEGAGALLLRRAELQDDLQIVQLADGFTYRNRNDAPGSARDCLAQFPADVVRCHTAQHNWFGRIEEQLPGGKRVTLPYHGDAFVASAAWNTVAAAELARREHRRILLPVWGLTGECSALLLAAE